MDFSLLIVVYLTILSLCRSLRLQTSISRPVRGLGIAKMSSSTIKANEVVRINGDHLVACQEDRYEELLQAKVDKYYGLMSPMLDPSNASQDRVEVFRSAKSGYRMRANFNVWRDRPRSDAPEDMYYAMFEVTPPSDEEMKVWDAKSNVEKKKNKKRAPRSTKQACEIKSFPQGTPLMNDLMRDLMVYLQEKDKASVSSPGVHSEYSKILRSQLFEVRIVTTQTRQASVILLYHCPLDEQTKEWNAAGTALIEYLQEMQRDKLEESKESNMESKPECIIKLVGRARKNKLVLPGGEGLSAGLLPFETKAERALKELEIEAIEEHYTVEDQVYTNYQVEGAFSQPNAEVCQHMLTWSAQVSSSIAVGGGSTTNVDNADAVGGGGAREVVKKEEDCLELYCGGGTFTSVLANSFRGVLATELNKNSVVLAKRAFAQDNIENISIAPVPSETFSGWYLTQNENEEKDTQNQKQKQKTDTDTATTNAITSTGIGEEKKIDSQLALLLPEVAKYPNLTTVVVDPPRAGLDEDTCKLLARFEKICYISCNPETLARDVAMIQALSSSSSSSHGHTHRIERIACFDQFPYSHHLEGGVLLVKEPKETKETKETKGESTEPPAAGEKRKLE